MDSVAQLFRMPLSPDQTAFMFLERSGVVLRTSAPAVAVDIADYIGQEDMAAMRIDALLYTHMHDDHYDRKTAVDAFKALGAPIMAQQEVAEDLEGDIPADKLFCSVLDTTHAFGAIKVTTVSSWTKVPPQNLYLIEIGDLRVFHSGDVGDVVLEPFPVDIAFLPTEGIAPSREEAPEYAFRTARDLKPRVAVGVHGMVMH